MSACVDWEVLRAREQARVGSYSSSTLCNGAGAKGWYVPNSVGGCQVNLGASKVCGYVAYRIHTDVTFAFRLATGRCRPTEVGVLPWVHREPGAHDTTQREVGTHTRVVVALHLDEELFANPRMGSI